MLGRLLVECVRCGVRVGERRAELRRDVSAERE